jgi:cystathionine beta-lyase
MRIETRLIHAGVEPDPLSGAIMTPVYQTSTYVQEAPGKHKGYEYARTQNPTRSALQASLANLEGGQHGIAFASGMAATDAVLKLLQPGDEVVAVDDLYGGTYRIFHTVFERYGIRFAHTNLRDAEALRPLMTPRTKLVWIETPTNPLLSIVDIEAVARIAHEFNARLCVDNTFASPYLQQPIALGADIVMHSATKYLGGHSDLILGALICRDNDLADQLRYIQNACGGVPGPQDCFLCLRGIKTLHLRMDRHSANAAAVARYLRDHPKVGKVYWPGFEDHPNHDIAKKQMKHFGGMVSFTLRNDDFDAALRVLSSMNLFSLAESLGGVESLIGHPASMTHASIPKSEREKTGVVDSLIRLSVGIEAVEDLIDDLKQALA